MEQNELSVLQIEIFDHLITHTWMETMKFFNIRSKSIFRTIVIRTALGFPWNQNQKGGADPYLTPQAENRLVHLLQRCALEHNCLRTCDVISIAHQLKAGSAILHQHPIVFTKNFVTIFD